MQESLNNFCMLVKLAHCKINANEQPIMCRKEPENQCILKASQVNHISFLFITDMINLMIPLFIFKLTFHTHI